MTDQTETKVPKEKKVKKVATKAPAKKRVKHYVNNADFLAGLIEYKRLCDVADKAKEIQPQVPNYIGECFLKIAEHLSHKPNFASYSFRDEMIADGIENCMMYFRIRLLYPNYLLCFSQKNYQREKTTICQI